MELHNASFSRLDRFPFVLIGSRLPFNRMSTTVATVLSAADGQPLRIAGWRQKTCSFLPLSRPTERTQEPQQRVQPLLVITREPLQQRTRQRCLRHRLGELRARHLPEWRLHEPVAPPPAPTLHGTPTDAGQFPQLPYPRRARPMAQGRHQHHDQTQIHPPARNRSDAGVTRLRQPSSAQQKLNRRSYPDRSAMPLRGLRG